jgi:hypothetical protein
VALEVRLQVIHPYHGPDGELLYEPGQQFPQDADLPEDLRTAPVIAEAQEAPGDDATAADVGAAPGPKRRPAAKDKDAG